MFISVNHKHNQRESVEAKHVHLYNIFFPNGKVKIDGRLLIILFAWKIPSRRVICWTNTHIWHLFSQSVHFGKKRYKISVCGEHLYSKHIVVLMDSQCGWPRQYAKWCSHKSNMETRIQCDTYNEMPTNTDTLYHCRALLPYPQFITLHHTKSMIRVTSRLNWCNFRFEIWRWFPVITCAKRAIHNKHLRAYS